jgi:hypothetical protein
MNDKHIQTTINLYLTWANNYLSVDSFAEYYGWSIETSSYIIALGRRINNQEDTHE